MALFTGHTITPDSALGGIQIQRSLRFNSADNEYLIRTCTSEGNRVKWTWSGWVKKTRNGRTTYALLSSDNGGDGGGNNGIASIYFHSSDAIHTYYDTDSGNNYGAINDTVYRDPNSWYHIVWQVDAANGTSKIWVNGVEQSINSGAQPVSGYNYTMNQSGKHMTIGTDAWDIYTFSDTYIAETHYSDGQLYAASDFGYTDAQTGQWRPKNGNVIKSNITYGTNGFWLDFRDATSTTTLGYDYSGNGNHWTLTNMSVTNNYNVNFTSDTPTSNFCVMSDIDKHNATITNGGLEMTQASDPCRARGTHAMPPNTGKYYYEMEVQTGASYIFGMKSTLRLGSGTSGDEGEICYYGHNGNKNIGNTDGSTTSSSYGATYTAGDTVAILYDSDAGDVYFYKNNTSQGLAISGINSETYQPYTYLDNYGTTPIVHFNFGQRPFKYTPPTGARGLSSKIFPSPVSAGVVNPNRFFDTITYTGNGATVRPMTGLAFKPDMVWVKGRDYDYTNHGLCDAVKFDTSYPTNRTMLYPNLTNAETLGGNYFAHYTSSGEQPFFEGGFILNNNTSGNNNGNTFVAWAWKAGGNTTSSLPFMIDDVGYATAAAAGLDGGTKNPTGASVSTEAGFSIVTYVASNGTNDTIYHGLNKAPEVLIAKDRDNSRDWGFYYSVNGTNTNWQKLNDTATEGSNNSGETLGGVSGSFMYLHEDYFQPAHTSFANGGDDGADKMVAYMWHSVPGFSKIGVYHGNGSSDGQFVHCGFRPAWVLLKRTSGSGQAWLLMDNKRSPSNPVTKTISPQSNRAEDLDTGGIPTDFLDTGFKCRGSGGDFNDSSYKYFFMAFAEQPSGTMFGLDANAR